MSEKIFVYMQSKFFRLIDKSGRDLPDFESYIFPIATTDGSETTRIFITGTVRTRFGIQGAIELYVGDRLYETEEEELADNPGWNLTCYREGFQEYLEFYTSPSSISGKRELHLYIPFSASNEDVFRRVAKYEYDVELHDELEDLEPADYFFQLIQRVIGKHVDIERINDAEVSTYVDEKFLDPDYIPPWHRGR